MMKKILAGALACAMAFSLSTVAYADDITTVDETTGTYTSGEITGTSSVTALTIKVTVPTDNFDVIVNPYQLEAKLADEDPASHDQIIAKSMDLVSDSNVDLAVGIKIGAQPADGSSAVVSTTPVTATTKTKSVFTYLEVTGGKEGFDAIEDGYNATKNKAQQFAFPALKTTGTGDSAKTTGYLEKAGVVTLANSSADAAKQKATFTLNGGAATNPTEVWTATDTLSYSITYNFVPVVTAPEPTATPGA